LSKLIIIIKSIKPLGDIWMTVCFSIKKPGFIITASDVLALNITTKEKYIRKKFCVNVKRNFVILMSGSYGYDSDPRKLFIEQIDKKIDKRDSMLTVSKKISDLINISYSQTPEKIDLQLQTCGYDGNTPHTYVVFPKKSIIEEHSTCVTGAQYVIDYTEINEGKRQMHFLNSLIPKEEIVITNVRRFMSNIIVYENDRAIKNGENPQTGGGINIVIVYPDKLAWVTPRFDSKDDPYKLN
jgi:hypothetical protein